MWSDRVVVEKVPCCAASCIGTDPGRSGHLRGQDRRKDNLEELRQKIGMVFQSYDLFPHLSVLDNITIAPIKVQKRKKEEVQAEARELLKRVGLEDKANSYPRQLSGGQKQRVAIVRALCMHPEILLFDEVTAALDPEMVREVLDVMLDLAKQGRTMIIVTHEMQFAKAVADKKLYLSTRERSWKKQRRKNFHQSKDGTCKAVFECLPV